jgi:hypothetical protein
MHQSNSSTGDPLPLQIIPDDRIENGDRTWNISLFEDRSIGVQGAAVQGK